MDRSPDPLDPMPGRLRQAGRQAAKGCAEPGSSRIVDRTAPRLQNGREQDYVTSGDCYLQNPHTGKPGRCPSNPSGGLLGTMHAVGATVVVAARRTDRLRELAAELPESIAITAGEVTRIEGPGGTIEALALDQDDLAARLVDARGLGDRAVAGAEGQGQARHGQPGHPSGRPAARALRTAWKRNQRTMRLHLRGRAPPADPDSRVR